MIYSNEEIELTLNFYSIAKLHIDNLNQALQFKELNDHEKNEYMFYSHIVDYSLVIAPVVADLCTTPVALSAPPNSYQNNSQS